MIEVYHPMEFKDNLKINEKNSNSSCDVDCFRALLGLPSNFDFNKAVPEYVIKMLHENYLKRLKEFTKDAMRIKNNQSSIIYNAMKNFGMNLESITHLAWFNEQYEVFEFLIRADCFYPAYFAINLEALTKNNSNEHLKKIQLQNSTINNFHTAIKQGELDKVKEFLAQRPNAIFLRNEDNKSALQVAFESEKFEIYSYMKANGLFFSDLKELALNYEKTYNLSDKKQRKIHQFNHRHLKSFKKEDYISKLVRKTKFKISRYSCLDTLKEKVRKAYEEINEYASDILEVASKSDNLEIVFDFEYPVLDEFIAGIGAYGASNYYFHYVYVGAANLLSNDETNRNFALGTIIHELTHYAMNLIYENKSKPYKIDDVDAKNLFTRILSDANSKKSIEKYFAYSDAVSNQKELIASVPDAVLTHKHNSTRLEIIKREFKELFDFYENRVLKDIRRLTATMNEREKIRDFNRWFNVEADIVSSKLKIPQDIQFQSLLDFIFDFSNSTKFKAIFTNSKSIVKKVILKKVRQDDKLAVFLKMTSTDPKYLLIPLKTIDHLNVDPYIFVVSDDIKFLSSYIYMLDETTFKRVIFIASEEIWTKFDKQQFEKYKYEGL